MRDNELPPLKSTVRLRRINLFAEGTYLGKVVGYGTMQYSGQGMRPVALVQLDSGSYLYDDRQIFVSTIPVELDEIVEIIVPHSEV